MAGVSPILGMIFINRVAAGGIEGAQQRGMEIKGRGRAIKFSASGEHDFASGVWQPHAEVPAPLELDGLEQRAVKVKDIGPGLLLSPQRELLADERVDLGPCARKRLGTFVHCSRDVRTAFRRSR